MKYQKRVDAAQVADETYDFAAGLRLSDAQINPATGLATDYLNRFNAAVMISSQPVRSSARIFWHGSR
jgi:hypothetical protein